MTPGDWALITEWFGDAMDAEPAKLEQLLRQAECESPVLAAELRSLLIEHGLKELSTRAFAEPPLRVESRVESPHPDAVGPYRILWELGRGGAGVVFLAERSDDEFHRPVALKVLRYAAWDHASAEFLTRERRALAPLRHTNIAALVDWGTSDDGTPWMAREFIDGKPIDEYCRERGAGLREILSLFEQVCEAVQYAHRHLIVHRDLKPANILVTESGSVKLLDFGVARLLDAVAATATAERRFTPAYASPEQIKGQPVTAASDVYSLGLLLYELLAGKLPYSAETLEEVVRRLEDRTPAPPSTAPGLTRELRRGIRGDLDSVVLHALERDPERRYLSVEQLLADLSRCRSGYPVLARRSRPAYRAWRFLRRNALPSAAVTLAAVAVVAGAGVAIWNARVAERRFEDVKGLAHSVMFDLHDSIRNIPGTLDARKKLVATALTYLDRLNAEHIRDDGLQMELAAGYYRMAWVQGGIVGTDTGDAAGGRRSYRTALDILDAQWLRHYGDPKTGALRFSVAYNFARSRSDPADGLAVAVRYAAEAGAWARATPGEASLNAAALLEQQVARSAHFAGELAETLRALDRSESLDRALLPYASEERSLPMASDQVTYRGVLHTMAITNAIRAGNLLDMGRVDAAVAAHREFRRLESAAQGLDAARAEASGLFTTAHAFENDVALFRGQPEEGIREARAELAEIESVHKLDRQQTSVVRDLADARRHLGLGLCARSEWRACASELEVAVRDFEQSARDDPGQVYNLFVLAGTLNDYGNALVKGGRKAAAAPSFQRALDTAQAALMVAPGRVDLIRERARACAGLARVSQDREMAQRSVADWAEFHRRSPLDVRMAGEEQAAARLLAAFTR